MLAVAAVVDIGVVVAPSDLSSTQPLEKPAWRRFSVVALLTVGTGTAVAGSEEDSASRIFPDDKDGRQKAIRRPPKPAAHLDAIRRGKQALRCHYGRLRGQIMRITGPGRERFARGHLMNVKRLSAPTGIDAPDAGVILPVYLPDVSRRKVDVPTDRLVAWCPTIPVPAVAPLAGTPDSTQQPQCMKPTPVDSAGSGEKPERALARWATDSLTIEG